ncbi:fumarylacetoacetate hydrolase family protein [Mucisphaera calidilacus]|uniref:Ureidoglycolate lyase n=1 Tax=Mucisphaera calidilacus TaxID=2527982 RepID=A0A518BW93_9BACT|nr:fumarylacetoacetate hydrolase family protein [Mucisphaera calidilacus]QDU71240.1 Ureidoglycolate lyase [Mucisphaera calidilacus]
MRIIRYHADDGTTHAGIETQPGTAQRLAGDPIAEGLATTGDTDTVARLLAPVVPPTIFCIGQNYRQHALETGAAIPEQPVIFMKPPTALQDPNGPIAIPRCCRRGDEVDYEVELAVVIGKRCRDVSERDALNVVFGYSVANDVSARRWQKHAGGGQWIRGKSFDTFCPLGPAIITADALPDPQDLQLTTTIHGETLQDSNTADMIFTVAELIAFLSLDTTLEPGTVILTGTPQGVGVARDPKRFLQPGDSVTVAIDGIGELTNPVVAG